MSTPRPCLRLPPPSSLGLWAGGFRAGKAWRSSLASVSHGPVPSCGPLGPLPGQSTHVPVQGHVGTSVFEYHCPADPHPMVALSPFPARPAPSPALGGWRLGFHVGRGGHAPVGGSRAVTQLLRALATVDAEFATFFRNKVTPTVECYQYREAEPVEPSRKGGWAHGRQDLGSFSASGLSPVSGTCTLCGHTPLPGPTAPPCPWGDLNPPC